MRQFARIASRMPISLVIAVAVILVNSQGGLACSTSISQGESCNLQTGTTADGVPCPWFIGGDQYVSQSMEFVGADISFQNPSPVWTSSSIWLAFEQGNSISQVGYVHIGYPGEGTPNGVIFVQYTYNDGNYSPLWEYNTPSSQESFGISYNAGGNPAYLFCWSENCSSPSTGDPGWSPNHIDTYGEIHDYTAMSQGSQAVGTVANPVNLGDIYWANTSGTRYTANLNYSAAVTDTAFYQAQAPTNGYSWTTYDSRCSS